MAAPASKPAPSKVQIVSGDFRQGSAATGLARKLFDPNEQLKLQPQLITQILAAAGIKTPTGVKIGADTAQILMAGGALVSNVETGAEIGAYLKPSGLLLKGVTDILSVSGLLPKDSPAALALNIAGDAALVVASGGLNVLADIAFVMDIIGAFFSSPPDRTAEYTAYANAMAKQKVQSWFATRETAQVGIAAQSFQAYQAGKLQAFELMGKIAEESPDLFLNYFPDLKYFIPPVIAKNCMNYRFQKTDRAGFQSRDYDITATQCLEYQTILNDRSRIQTGLFNKFVLEPAYPYQLLSQMGQAGLMKWGFPTGSQKLGVKPHDHPAERIKIADLAILSLFPPYFQFISDDFDIKPWLKSLYLTPSDLGYTVVGDQMTYGDFGGTTQDEWQRVVSLDQGGNVGALLSNPKAAQIVTEWGVVPHFPEDQVNDFFRAAYPSPKSIPIPESIPARQTTYQASKEELEAEWTPSPPEQSDSGGIHADQVGYRNIRNFWSTVQMATKIASDPYYRNFDVESRIGSFLSTAQAIDDKHRKLQMLSVSRKMNALARQRIASYYGTTPDKLRWKKTQGPGDLLAVLPA